MRNDETFQFFFFLLYSDSGLQMTKELDFVLRLDAADDTVRQAKR